MSIRIVFPNLVDTYDYDTEPTNSGSYTDSNSDLRDQIYQYGREDISYAIVSAVTDPKSESPEYYTYTIDFDTEDGARLFVARAIHDDSGKNIDKVIAAGNIDAAFDE